MKRLRILIWVLLLSFILPMVPVSGQAEETDIFSRLVDIPDQNNWAYDGIHFCVEYGYMNGTSNTTFSADANLTRGQLVTILHRIEGCPETAITDQFVDVDKDIYYAEAIAWAAENDIVNGIDDSHFAPNKDITREQIAAILFRYCGAPDSERSLEEFPDRRNVSDYAVDAMRWCVEAKLINGTSDNGTVYLRPQNYATRGQIATILMRLLNIVQYEISLEAYEGLDDYRISDRISTDIDWITAPYEDTYGALENDKALVEEVSMLVYDWSLALADAGIIEGSSYNEQGKTVAFFLKDGSTYVYFPQIDQCYSGDGNDFAVMSITSLGLMEDAVITGFNPPDDWFSAAGAVDAAKEIYKNVPEYTEHINMTNSKTTVDDLRRAFAALSDDGVRVIFWRSHGNVYTDSEGVVQTAFVINEKKTRENELKYYDDRHSGGNVPQTLALSGKKYAINGNFFDVYMCNMSGGLFYCGACQSANGNLGDIILEKGFDAFCGSSGDIFTFYSDDMMSAVADGLIKADENHIYPTIVEALNEAKEEVGNDCLGVSVILRNADDSNPFRVADYRLAYAKVLQEKDSSNNFCLTHIDGDEIPELLVFQGFQHFAQVEVYTYYDGKACFVGQYPEYGEIYFSYKNNAIFSRYMQMGIYISGYFGIKDGKEVHIGDEGSSIYDNYEFMHLSFFAGEACNKKNINAMLKDTEQFVKKP